MYKNAIKWPSAIDAPTIDRTEETKKHLYEALKKNQLMNGVVDRVEDYGVIIRFSANFHGLLHISEIVAEWVDDPNDYFKKGQQIKVYVIDIQEDVRNTKYKVSLSAKRTNLELTRKPKRIIYTGRRIKVTSSGNDERTIKKNSTIQDLMNKYNKNKI